MKEDFSLLKSVSIKQSFLSMLQVQHMSSEPADIHEACCKFMSKAGSVCRGSYSYPNWKTWNSEVVVTPSEMGENSPAIHTCSVVLLSALDLRCEIRVYKKSSSV